MGLDDLFGSFDGDSLKKVIALVNDNQEVLGQLAKLPEVFEKFGSGLDAAGDQAREAAKALMGDDGKSGIRGALDGASDSLADIAKKLASGADAIEDAAKGVAKVPLMDGPAKTFAGAAKQIGGTTDQMSALAESMEKIAGLLENVGDALDKLGDNLGQSSTEVKGFMSRE